MLIVQVDWVPDCYHHFYCTVTAFLEIQFPLLLLLLEHTFVQGGEHG